MTRAFARILSPSLLALAAALAAALPAAAARSQDPDGAGLQERINAAIDRGREHLLRRLAELTANTPGDYPMGRLALPLAACLKAGARANDARVTAAFAKLEKMPLEKTYCVACYLFALDALALRSYKEALEKSRGGDPLVRGGGAEHRAAGKLRDEMAKCVNWLVGARADGVGYWSYPFLAKDGPQRHDFSNTQFAVLGLQIGLEHGIPIPRRVFEEIADIFVKTQHLLDPPEEIEVTYSLSLKDLLSSQRRRASSVKFRVQPGGWEYTAENRGAKASMTAAGASSLLVARNGLGGADSARTAEVEKAIVRAYAWIARNFDSYLRFGGGAHGLYSLYSLEKVGDLGDVEKLGPHDWYVEGARRLVADQSANGSWGSYVDTSFALLFLTRATRLKPFSAPKITTRAQGEGGAGVSRELVFIARLNGFVAAKEILRLLEESRDPGLVAIAQEAVENYNRSYLEDLVPDLIRMWTKSNDRVSRFARESLEEITGLKSAKREDYETWLGQSRQVAALAQKPRVSAAEIAALLDVIASPVLKGTLIELANRHRLFELAGRLADELSAAEPTYRLKVHSVLNLWSGRALAPPEEKDLAGWKDAAESWRNWAATQGRQLVARGRLGELLAGVDGANGREAARLVDEIVALGPEVVPELERATQSEDFSFSLIEALERLKGTAIGLR
jgi:hypothetical protein